MEVKIIIFSLLLSFYLLLSGCTTTSNFKNHTKDMMSGTKIINLTNDHYTPTNPNSIIIIAPKTKLDTNYKKIAAIEVSKYNLVGVKRQQGVVDDLLQKYTAAAGGNAIIDVHIKKTKVTGTIIRFT
jgi:hypothetical protein